MVAKSDNAAEIGMHVFERAGLGKAPFRCIGSTEKVFQAAPGEPSKPGSSCDYCGTGIQFEYWIKGSDGRTFKVGCDCLERTGDAGLIKAYKKRPEVRARNREIAKRRDDRIKAEWAALMADEAATAKLNTFTVDRWNGGTEPWLDFAKRAWGYCGAAGRARYLKAAKKLLSVKGDTAEKSADQPTA